MPKIQIISDCHVEFDRDSGQKLMAQLELDCDILVVAGDLHLCAHTETWLETIYRLADAVEDLVYVAGNHEYYRSSPTDVLGALSLLDDAPGVHVLEDCAKEVQGVKFAGGTMWFAQSPSAHADRWAMSDFSVIKDFEPWVYETNRQFLDWLRTHSDVDVIVTHHAPSRQSIAARWVGNPLNPYFVCREAAGILYSTPAALWVHGHMHDACDYYVNGTRVLCNPRGYPHEREGRRYVPCVVDL